MCEKTEQTLEGDHAAIEELRLMQHVTVITDKELSSTEQFPSLFQSLSKLQVDCTIQLQEGAKPFALSAPCRVAFPLLQAMKQELQCLDELGVIEKVKEPTEWCVGMVVMPEKNNKFRIYIDLTGLNQSVHKERHPSPAVDQTLAQTARAKIFTKLDAKSGLWQITLSTESALLTTFITSFGRFCFH